MKIKYQRGIRFMKKLYSTIVPINGKTIDWFGTIADVNQVCRLSPAFISNESCPTLKDIISQTD